MTPVIGPSDSPPMPFDSPHGGSLASGFKVILDALEHFSLPNYERLLFVSARVPEQGAHRLKDKRTHKHTLVLQSGPTAMAS